MRRLILLVVCTLVTAVVSAPGAESKAAVKPPRIDPASATLAQAIEDWVHLLEVDLAKAPQRAAERWAKDEEAAGALKRHWAALQERHAEFDYRTWIKGGKDRPAAAEKIGEADTFTVGGHEFGHLHTRWTKTGKTWRIAGVFLCR